MQRQRDHEQFVDEHDGPSARLGGIEMTFKNHGQTLRYPHATRGESYLIRTSFTTVKTRVDLIGAALLTVAVAAFVAWWYSLDETVLQRFGLFYVGMFAIAIGVPTYYLLRSTHLHRMSTN
jgi:hypothetical protein